MKPPDNDWLWGELSEHWLEYGARYGLAMAQRVEARGSMEARHARLEQQRDDAILNGQGIVAVYVLTGHPVPTIPQLLDRHDRRRAHAPYKIKTARDLSRSHYGFIFNEADDWIPHVDAFLLVYAWELRRRFAIVGEIAREDGLHLASPGWWMPHPNPVVAHHLFRPYAGPIAGPPPPFTECPHGAPVGDRCYTCQPLDLSLFPPQLPSQNTKRRAKGTLV